jgi:hypothetical protein
VDVVDVHLEITPWIQRRGMGSTPPIYDKNTNHNTPNPQKRKKERIGSVMSQPTMRRLHTQYTQEADLRGMAKEENGERDQIGGTSQLRTDKRPLGVQRIHFEMMGNDGGHAEMMGVRRVTAADGSILARTTFIIG